MLKPGDVLRGRYHIRDTLGRGGMADVYLALDGERQANVAIKVLREDLAEEPEFIRRFTREAEALAKLDHPNIVRFYSFEVDGRLAFIVMDYVAGGTLRGHLRDRNAPLPVAEATLVLRQVGAALHYAHRRGFVHRDIKPANIMFREDGTALLSDFGIAKAVETATTTHAETGTPAYMSPEQILGQALDCRTDVYSLGVVLYEMVAGRRPFIGELGTGSTTAKRVQDEHLRLPPPDPRQFNPAMAEGAARIILRALAKSPADRWPDAMSLVSAWQDALGLGRAVAAPVATSRPQSALRPQPGTSPAVPPKPQAGQQPPAPARSSPRPWLIVSGLAALVLLATVAAFTAVALLGQQATAATPTAAPSTRSVPTPTPVRATPAAPTATTVFTYEDEWGVVVVKRGEPVRIGFAAALGGDPRAIGVDEQRGAELALADKPQVLGFPVALAPEDDGCSPEGGVRVTEQFISDPSIVAVIGHMCSNSSLAAMAVYERVHLTMVSPSSTGADLTTPGVLAFNRVCWNDVIQARAAAAFLRRQLGLERVATVHDGGTFSRSLAIEMANTFTAQGGRVVAEEAADVGEDDMRPLLERVKAADAQAVYFSGGVAEAALLARQRLDVGLGNLVLIGSGAIMGQDFVATAGRAAAGVYATSIGPPRDSPALADFLGAYRQRYGEEPPGPFHAYAYDATMVILAAIEKVGRVDPDGNLHIGRRALAESIRNTRNHRGLSGPINCDDHGDCGSAAVIVYQVRNGAFEVVWRPQR